MRDLKRKLGVFLYPAFKEWRQVKAGLIRYPESTGNYTAIPAEQMKALNRERFHGAKRLFCYNPFVNLFFDTYGNAVACCRSHQNVLGTYPQQSLKEIWFGEKAQQMREHMRHNDLQMGCDYCKLQLASNRLQGLPSMHAEEFATSAAGNYPRIMEFELSNICNLECVMCSGRVSSAIRKNREGLEPLPCPYDDEFVEQLKDFIPHLRKAFFYGGEPFLIPLYYKIWDLILKLNPGMELYAVTNGTVMNQRIEELLKKAHFNLIVSVDSLDKEQAEIIRKGCDFDEVLKNFEIFRKISGRKISVSHTPMTLNWRETPAIIEFCNKRNTAINLSYVEGPAKYALWSLLPEQLDEIHEVYQQVHWAPGQNDFQSRYNIKVFNELRNQVLYFRNRNREILDSYRDLAKRWNDERENIHRQFTEMKNGQSGIDPVLIVEFLQAFDEITAELEPKPWYLESLKKISGAVAGVHLLEQNDFQEQLRDKERLRGLFGADRQAAFFSEYY